MRRQSTFAAVAVPVGFSSAAAALRIAVSAAVAALLGVSALAAPGPPRTERLNGNHVIFHQVLDQHFSYANVWGYTAPNGREYALLGTYDGTAVIDITDRRGSREVGFVPGPPSSWREIKTYGSWAYVVTEGGGGLQIISLADPTHPALLTPNWNGFSRAHTLWVDEAAGTAFIAGRDVPSGQNGGVMILRLVTPTTPVIMGYWDNAYAHDVYARDGRMYVSAIYQGSLYILDIANLASPAFLGVISDYPSAFTHNAGPTDDGSHVLTTDERTGAFVRMWDIADPATPSQSSAYRPYHGSTSSPHNVHVDGDLAYVSWYTMGALVLDISDPSEIREVGSFDTHPGNDSPSFEGCWGVFPYYPNSPGLFVASDISAGLFVLEYEEAAAEVEHAGDAARPLTPEVATRAPAPARVSVGSAFPNPTVRLGAALEVRATSPMQVAVDVLDAAGRRVRTLGDRVVPAGSSILAWDGRDGAGRPVAPGTYLVRIVDEQSTTARKVVVTR